MADGGPWALYRWEVRAAGLEQERQTDRSLHRAHLRCSQAKRAGRPV